MSRLFDEFAPVTTAEWRAAIEKDLKGADFEKRLVKRTLDGIALQPFYREEDLPKSAGPLPAGRGVVLREEIRETDLDEANLHLRRAIGRGVREFVISVYPTGVQIDEPADLDRLLDEVDLGQVALHWNCGPLARPLLPMLASHATGISGSFDLDPVMDRAAEWTTDGWKDWGTETAKFVSAIQTRLPGFGLFAIRGAFIEKAGASIAQELGWSLAVLSESLSACQDGGLDLNDILGRSEVRFGIGTHYVLEIAKLRAARILLANLARAYDCKAAPRIHAVTTSSNKTLYDPHNNLLRATIESMAAMIGGADSLSPAAYDQGYHTPDEFSEHLARNTVALLGDEAYLNRVSDPLAGSYTIERLTAEYADAGWRVFCDLEDRGGFIAALPWVASELRRVQTARSEQVSRRRRTIVGTTVYANPVECRMQDVQAHFAPKQVRGSGRSERPSDWLADTPVPSSAFDPFRSSWPFEHLRLRVERTTQEGRARPVVHLVLAGDAKMRSARSAFCQNFFAAGGYEIRQSLAEDVAGAVGAAADCGADLIVLCSSDDGYLDLAKLAGPAKGAAILVVAGALESQFETLQACGVDELVHARQDHLATLQAWHDRLGIPDLPLSHAREEALV